MIVPVVLSGGSGTRLWPLSRELYPKQFLRLTGNKTLLQNTVERVSALDEVRPPLLICNQEHRFMVAEQLREIGVTPTATILEPLGRNTAPAVAVAAFYSVEHHDDPVLLVLPSDHVVEDHDALRAAVELAMPWAIDGHLLTFGVPPRSAETAFGYIRAGSALGRDGVVKVREFVEKPERETAEGYLRSGEYFWNSGMFLFRASVFLAELERYAPEIHAASRRAFEQAARDLDFVRLPSDTFAACPSDSLDYAVMEHTERAAVVPLDTEWSDLGSWSALWDISSHDEKGNTCSGEVLTHDTEDCFLHTNERLLATVGVSNLVVVETPDAVLVANKDRVQEVKEIVEQLKTRQSDQARQHRKVYRPWGCYDSVDSSERFQVKRITVNPGARLSLQVHHHRAEHWIVVKGTAEVTKGEESVLLTENQSTYIPVGTAHRLGNPGRIPLELIEVQSGSYLGEDDIVRLDDQYGR